MPDPTFIMIRIKHCYYYNCVSDCKAHYNTLQKINWHNFSLQGDETEAWVDRKIKKIVYRIDQLREKPNNERQFLVNRFLNHKYRIEWFFKNIFCLQLSFCRKITGKYEENESLNTESNCAKYSNTHLNETMRQRQTCLSILNTWKLAIKFDVSVKW